MTEKNLRTLIEHFEANGAVVVLLGVRGGLLTDTKADLYESLAREYGTVYVSDVLAGILLSPELMSDSIHPNDAGYARISARLYDIFRTYELVPTR